MMNILDIIVGIIPILIKGIIALIGSFILHFV
jgi:hypothetical protein